MDVNVYLDASVIVALFMKERFTARAERYFRSAEPVPLVSDFAAAEFASALARRVRMGELAAERALMAFTAFDTWTAQATQHVEIKSADVSAAKGFIRRLDLPLRTPDAVHIAIAQRLGASLATFDEKMALAAGTLGVATEPI